MSTTTSGACATEHLRSRFTGKERDTESGNDYFGARYYASSMGRFLNPDWSDGPDTIPYAKYGDPQTLNLYTYAGNNPLRNIDPDGHDCIYFSSAGNASVKSGDCFSDTDSGIYVNGTITSLNYNSNSSSWSFSYNSYDNGNLGTGTIANAPAPGPEPRMDEGAVTDDSGAQLLALSGAGRGLQIFRLLASALQGAKSESALVPPAYANTPGGFVNWLKNLSHDGTKLNTTQADAIVAQARQLGVDVRLDPPHPGTSWDVPHLNIGREGQVHLEVPEGYSNSTIPQGSTSRP
jgi:RHS repeat-associated protein